MRFKATYATNFLRVFRLPNKFPSDYCFGGGHSVNFVMVDWFNAFGQLDFGINTVKEFDDSEEWYQQHISELKGFIIEKSYFNPLFTYLVITDYGDCFIVNPETKCKELQKALEQMSEQSQETGNGSQ